jgi:hypothetical protein
MRTVVGSPPSDVTTLIVARDTEDRPELPHAATFRSEPIAA